MNSSSRFTTALLAVAIFTGITSVAAQQEPTRSIVNLSGDLYRAQNNNHFTLFLVTSEGIIMTDPINRDFSNWLKAEFAQRFGVPVRYVLYTHHHWDHASGGEVFAESAEFIGHENMPAALAVPAGNPPLPLSVRSGDANGNGSLERSEASGALADMFDLTDENRNGALSGAEVIRGPLNEVHPPTRTYSDRQTITLGGKRVDIVYIGTAHSRDMSVMYFPAERVVFGADVVQVRRLPMGVDPTLGEWVDAFRTIAELDFDVVAPGHGIMGTKADITAFQQYFTDLAAGVAAGIAAGKSLQEIQGSLTLAPYAAWERYEAMLPTHIGQVYANLKGSP